MQKNEKKFQKWLLKKLFAVSDLPVLFRDLLEANALFVEKMPVDPAKMHYKFRLFNTYAIYSALCIIIVALIIIATHYFFARIDVHFSLVLTIAITALIIIGFDLFRLKTRHLITRELLQRAWAVHFPHFAFDKYSKIVAQIYADAVKKDISRSDLEAFVLEQIVQKQGNLGFLNISN